MFHIVYLCKSSAYPPIQESKKETIQLTKRAISDLWFLVCVCVCVCMFTFLYHGLMMNQI